MARNRKKMNFSSYLLGFTVVLAICNAFENYEFLKPILIGLFYVMALSVWIEGRRLDLTFIFGIIAVLLTAMLIVSYLK